MPPLHLVVALLFAAGDPPETGEGRVGPGRPTQPRSGAWGRDLRAAPRKPLPEKVPQPEGAPVTGEVPEEVLDAVRKDLVRRAGAERGAVAVKRAEAVVFPDGSLGCARPGEKYTQAPVEGYRVVLEHGGKEYDYRVTRPGHLVLCERPPRGRAPGR